MVRKEIELQQILQDFPEIKAFLDSKGIIGEPVRLSSKWRKENEIIAVSTVDGRYVVKRLNQQDARKEIEYQHLLTRTYPSLFPKILASSGNTFVMEYADGNSLFTTIRQKSYDLPIQMQSVGEAIKQNYPRGVVENKRASGISQLKYSLRYAREGKTELLTKILTQWEGSLTSYTSQLIHNDLNTANVLIAGGNQVEFIDPRADSLEIEDLAKDLGRLVAGVTSNMYDNGYSSNESYLSTLAFLEYWQNESQVLLARIAFYVAQSFLSFSRWPMQKLTQDQLYDIGVVLLKHSAKNYKSTRAIVDIVNDSMEKTT